MKDGRKEHIYNFESNWENVFESVEVFLRVQNTIISSEVLYKNERTSVHSNFFKKQGKGVGHKDQYQSI